MKKVKINSIADLEKFIENENISLEDRLKIFAQALDSYPLYILEVKYDDTCNVIENRDDVEAGMRRIIADIIINPDAKAYGGMWICYEHND